MLGYVQRIFDIFPCRLDIDMSANMFMVQCKEAIASLDKLKSDADGNS